MKMTENSVELFVLEVAEINSNTQPVHSTLFSAPKRMNMSLGFFLEERRLFFQSSCCVSICPNHSTVFCQLHVNLSFILTVTNRI